MAKGSKKDVAKEQVKPEKEIKNKNGENLDNCKDFVKVVWTNCCYYY